MLRSLRTYNNYMHSEKPPLTLEELEGHCEGTASQLLYLQLAAAGECRQHVCIVVTS